MEEVCHGQKEDQWCLLIKTSLAYFNYLANTLIKRNYHMYWCHCYNLLARLVSLLWFLAMLLCASSMSCCSFLCVFSVFPQNDSFNN